MYKQDYGKYLNKSKDKKKNIRKSIWGWTKIGIFLFIIVSMLWGCVQTMLPEYTISQVADMTGKKVFAPGLSFEIIITSLGDFGSKSHWFEMQGDGSIIEYSYKAVSNWGEAFTVTSSPFYGFFVYPLAFILVGFLRLFAGAGENGLLDHNASNYGVSVLFAILLTSIFVRSITLGFTWKTQKNQERMQGLQLKQAEIQAKYKGSLDPQAKQKQQSEMMALYKKEGISPMSSLATSFLSMPFLFAMFSIVRSTHALKVAEIGQISLVEQPWTQVTSGNWIYFTLIAVYLPLQITSMMLPLFLQMAKQKSKSLNEQQRKARKKQIIMQVIFIVVFIFIVATIASGVAIYWIFSSTFQIFQTLGFHIAKETKPARIKKRKEKEKLKLQKALENQNSKDAKH